MYLTPDRFRAMGFGIDLADVEDVDLRQIIARATALVNAYCAVPMLPANHDFRGGSIASEQHNWKLPDLTITSAGGTRRVYMYHQPVQTITDFKVKFTNTYEVSIDPANLYINKNEGWAEVVSLAAVVSGIYPVGINFGLYTPVAEISYTYGWNLSSTGEYLEPTDAGTYRSSNCWWASTTLPKIYKNGVEESAANYTVDYNEGTVTFSSLLAATDTVTADYRYKLPSPIAEATGFVVAHLLGERDLQLKGMAGIGRLRVAEVELWREGTGARGGPTAVTDEIEPEIGALLAPYVYHSVR